MNMHRFDLIKHTLYWVWGACILWNQTAKQFNNTDSQEFQEFVHRCHNVVWGYLRERQVLDSTCSDFECHLALDAKTLFGNSVSKET